MSSHGGGTRRQTTTGGAAGDGARIVDAYTGDRFESGEAANGRNALKSLFGRALSDAEIGGLVGAQPGDTVTLTAFTPNKVSFKLESPGGGYTALRSIEEIPGRGLALNNNDITIHPTYRQQGLGTRIFASQAHAASRLGVKSISAEAEGELGDRRFNGYYVWPRLGYNAPFQLSRYTAGLSPTERRSIPDQVRRARDFHALMSTQVGRDWWREHGHTVQVSFDLRPGSKSLQILDAYLKERGIKAS